MLFYKDIVKSARNLLKRALISFCYLTVSSKRPKNHVFTFLIERFHNQITICINKVFHVTGLLVIKFWQQLAIHQEL